MSAGGKEESRESQGVKSGRGMAGDGLAVDVLSKLFASALFGVCIILLAWLIVGGSNSILGRSVIDPLDVHAFLSWCQGTLFIEQCGFNVIAACSSMLGFCLALYLGLQIQGVEFGRDVRSRLSVMRRNEALDGLLRVSLLFAGVASFWLALYVMVNGGGVWLDAVGAMASYVGASVFLALVVRPESALRRSLEDLDTRLSQLQAEREGSSVTDEYADIQGRQRRWWRIVLERFGFPAGRFPIPLSGFLGPMVAGGSAALFLGILAFLRGESGLKPAVLALAVLYVVLLGCLGYVSFAENGALKGVPGKSSKIDGFARTLFVCMFLVIGFMLLWLLSIHYVQDSGWSLLIAVLVTGACVFSGWFYFKRSTKLKERWQTFRLLWLDKKISDTERWRKNLVESLAESPHARTRPRTAGRADRFAKSTRIARLHARRGRAR